MEWFSGHFGLKGLSSRLDNTLPHESKLQPWPLRPARAWKRREQIILRKMGPFRVYSQPVEKQPGNLTRVVFFVVFFVDFLYPSSHSGEDENCFSYCRLESFGARQC